jgi:acetoin utilization deacetylase AcuC-like enzyme
MQPSNKKQDALSGLKIARGIAIETRGVHYTAARDFYRPVHAKSFLEGIPELMQRFEDCDVLLYQAGADPHIDDPLGGWLTTPQLARRDQLVFEQARRLEVPVVWNLAGGYQSPLSKVIEIHDNTLRACLRAYLSSVDDR